MKDITKKVASLSTRVSVFIGLIATLLILMGWTTLRAESAREKSIEAGQKIDKVDARVDVHEERFLHILKGIERIEKKLEKKE